MTPRIYIIDDEECIRDSLRWFLEDLGYEVVTVSEPKKCDVYNGHDCSQNNACGHALIIDHNMPNMTGIEFIEHLMKRGCKGIVSNMLVISGNMTAVDMKKAAILGCTIAQKPVSYKFIQKWLEGLPIVFSSD